MLTVHVQPGGEELIVSHAVSPLPSNLTLTSVPFSDSVSLEEVSRPSSPINDSGYSSGSFVSPTSKSKSLRLPPLVRCSSAGSSASLSPSASASTSPSRSTESGDGDLDSDSAAAGPPLRDATRSFFGGMNNHSGAAKELMRVMRVARLGE